jgi:hypothetical protein
MTAAVWFTRNTGAFTAKMSKRRYAMMLVLLIRI